MNKNANQNEYMNLTEEHQLSENAAMHFKPLKEPNSILHFLGLILKVFFYTICFIISIIAVIIAFMFDGWIGCKGRNRTVAGQSKLKNHEKCMPQPKKL